MYRSGHVRAKLYSLSVSHPSLAAARMLELKRVEHAVVDLPPGLHPLVVRAAGFRGGTVPALRLDGRRIQGSLAISRALDALVPEPPLFPREPERRRAVVEAEAWGERELQPIPRRLFRWAAPRRPAVRRMLAADAGIPAPGLVARLNAPVARHFARVSQATDARVRADLEALPGLLERVDRLLEAGVLGGWAPNAADLQIGSTVRALLGFEELGPLARGRPAGELALRLFPRYPGPVRAGVPSDWLPTPP